jgi:phytol kinase
MGYILCQYLEKGHAIPYIVAMNIQGLILSFLFIGVVIALGLILSKSERCSAEFVRKFIHIGVSNWWLVLIATFDTLSYALVVPVLFTILNSVAVFTGMANVLGISDRRRNLGLIYFPISLLFLVLLGYTGTVPLWACGMGFLTMGYGDGLAAILGKRFGRWKIRNDKSLMGTLVMFVVTMLVVVGFSIGYALPGIWGAGWWAALLVIGATASILEAYTPHGLDNLTVPLGTMAVAFLLLGRL